MLKIEYKNAQVSDYGYGLSINGKSLSDIISTALCTRAGDRYGYRSNLPKFDEKCCNVTVIIDPQPVTELIETDKEIWYSVEDMEECRREQFSKKTETAES